MLSASDTILLEIRQGYRRRDGERETTRTMRRLHFTSMGECVHLRDSLLMNCWDTGYRSALSSSDVTSILYHIQSMFLAAQRFNMLASAQREYLDGYRAGRELRGAM